MTNKILLAFGLLFALTFFASPAPAREARLKLATLAPKGTTYYQLLMEMGSRLRQLPGGGINLTVYPDGVMGGEADMVKRMRIGQAQMSLMTASGMAEIDPSIAALQNMPMMFRDFTEVELARDALRPTIEAKFREKGFVLLTLGDVGWVHFFANRPALTPQDFQQLKLFALASDVQALDIWKAAGFSPVPLEPTDMLTGLKTGLIDAVPAPPTYALAGQFYGPAPHLLELKWAPLVGGLVISREAFDRLGPEMQNGLGQIAKEISEQLMARSREENAEAIAAMQKRGLIVHPAAPEIEAAWRTTAEKAYPLIRGKIVPADLFDRVRELLAKHRGQ